jgi:hypothetical protein
LHGRPVAVIGATALAIALSLFAPVTARAQEIPGRRLQDIHLLARFHDGYWEWYQDYLQRRDEQRQRTTEIRIQLAVIAAERKKLRAEWLKFLYLENQLTPKSEYDAAWGPYWQAFLGSSSAADLAGTSSVGGLAGEARREIDDVAFRWSAGIWGAPLVSEEGAGAQLGASYQGERDLRRTRINEWKETQGDLIEEALHLNGVLTERCQTQKEKSGDSRPWLNAELQRLDDELPILKVQLYDAAQWYLPNELPALIEDLDLDNRATEEVAALMRAKLYLARAAWDDEKTWLQMTSPRQAPPDPTWIMATRVPRLEAIVNLRRVLQINPENAEARGMLMETELYWLREIAAKLDLERRASLTAFREYISARGFYADQPADWSEDLYEVVAAFWGLGPIALTAGLPGLDVAGARATELDVTQTQAAKNQVAMLSIMRLVKNGVPLGEIPTLTPDEIAKQMTLHTADGRRLPADKARRTAQDIRETFSELDDLRLLASADPEYLVEDVNLAFGTVYYAPLDPSYTWYESFGDLFNVHNVAFLWGPGAIVTMNGKLATVGALSSAEIQAAEQAGQILTGRQAFLSVTRLDRLAETIAATSIGSRWANALAADKAARQGLTGIDTVVDLGARLASAAVLYTGATYLANEAGIPGAALLVELLGEIGPGELLSDVVVRSGASVEELAKRLDEFTELLARQRDELAGSRRLLDEVSGLAAEMSEETLDAGRRNTMQTRLGEIVEQLEEHAATRPAGSVAEPVDQATKTAAEALQNGNVSEAAPAITGAVEIAEGAGSRLDEAIKLTEEAIARLDAAAGAPQLRIIPADEMKTIRQLYGEGPGEKFWRPDLYAPTGPGRSLQLGDEAIRAGELEAAAEHFRAARREIYANGDIRNLRRQLDHAEGRLDLVVNAQRAGDDLAALRQSISPSDAALPIDASAATEALENLDGERAARNAAPVGSANPVYVTRDNAGNTYYAKEIVPTPGNPMTENLTPEDIERILTTEAASSALAQRVGLNVAATHYDPERRMLVSRAIPSESAVAGTLASRPEHVTLALRKEYAQQRLFRAWLGDSDGHLGNMIIGDDGRLYLLDFDQAVLSGTTSRHIRGTQGQSERALLEGTVQFSAFVGPQSEGVIYRWMARLDQTISYADVRETVEAIRELVANPAELRKILTDAGYPDVDGAMRSLTERAGMLEETLRPLFDGGLLRMGVAWLRSGNGGPLAFLPARGRLLASLPARSRLLALLPARSRLLALLPARGRLLALPTPRSHPRMLPGTGLPLRAAPRLPDSLPRAA